MEESGEGVFGSWGMNPTVCGLKGGAMGGRLADWHLALQGLQLARPLILYNAIEQGLWSQFRGGGGGWGWTLPIYAHASSELYEAGDSRG